MHYLKICQGSFIEVCPLHRIDIAKRRESSDTYLATVCMHVEDLAVLLTVGLPIFELGFKPGQGALTVNASRRKLFRAVTTVRLANARSRLTGPGWDNRLFWTLTLRFVEINLCDYSERMSFTEGVLSLEYVCDLAFGEVTLIFV